MGYSNVMGYMLCLFSPRHLDADRTSEVSGTALGKGFCELAALTGQISSIWPAPQAAAQRRQPEFPLHSDRRRRMVWTYKSLVISYFYPFSINHLLAHHDFDIMERRING
jgi:hypothetical protein